MRKHHRAIDALNDYLGRKMAEAKEVRNMLATESSRFNARQVALLRNALNNASVVYSFRSHMRSHRIAMETARKDLAELESVGLLSKSKAGKRNIYQPIEDLSDVLKVLPGLHAF
jgi:Fic family protein